MALRILTAPEIEPISITEAKQHVRIIQTAEDSIIDRLIKTAREDCENFTGRALVGQEWQVTLDEFPCGAIVIPKPPLVGVSSITYVDTAGVTQTLSASNYVVHGAYDVTDATPEIAPPYCQPGYVVPAYGYTWPSVRCQPEAVTITFECGYSNADDADPIPSGLISGMHVRIADLFGPARESIVIGTIVNQTDVAERLWWPFKVFGVAA